MGPSHTYHPLEEGGCKTLVQRWFTPLDKTLLAATVPFSRMVKPICGAMQS